MIDLGGYLIVGGCAAVTTAVSTPIVAVIARRRNWMAQPDERRSHPVATPDVGGIAFFIGLISAIALAGRMDRFTPLFDNNSEIFGVVIAAAVIFVLGFINDIREVSAPMKVTGVVLSALVLVWFGVTMFYFRVPFLDVFVLSNDWIPLFTVLWLLGMTQAINLIDGLDGLAAGIVAIASVRSSFKAPRRSRFACGPNIGPLIAITLEFVWVSPFNFNPLASSWVTGASYWDCSWQLLPVSSGTRGPGLASIQWQTYFFLAPLFIPLLVLRFQLLTFVCHLAADGESPGHCHRRPRAPPSPTHCLGPRSTTSGGHLVGMDGIALRRCAVSGLEFRIHQFHAPNSCRIGAGLVHRFASPLESRTR